MYQWHFWYVSVVYPICHQWYIWHATPPQPSAPQIISRWQFSAWTVSYILLSLPERYRICTNLWEYSCLYILTFFKLNKRCRAGIAQLVERLPNLTLWSSDTCDRSQSQAPPMLPHKYVDENGSAAMLATKRSAGVTLEESEDSIVHRWQSTQARGIQPGFEIQGRCH